MKSTFIASPFLGASLEAKALDLGRSNLKRKRQQALKTFARLLVDLGLIETGKVHAVGYGVDASGAPGVVVAYEPVLIEGRVFP